jgi:phosphotransferase system enzyme I (PtsI)
VTLACTGIGIASGLGIAIGRTYLLPRRLEPVTPRRIAAAEIDAEIQRYRSAVRRAISRLQAVRDQIPDNTPTDIVEFVDTHLLMMADKALSDVPIESIRSQRCSAEWALQLRRDALIRVFESMEDPYLRTRRDDLDHVVQRIQSELAARPEESAEDLSGRILLAEDLTPADLILFHHRGVVGFITEYGGPMSHTAILARSLGLPALMGARGATGCLRHDEDLILDANVDVALTDCDHAIRQYYQAKQARARKRVLDLRLLRNVPAITLDGIELELMANIELPQDLEAALDNGASGVGLYRTEFLYMNRDAPPDEEEQFQAYAAIVRRLRGRPITIRTLDLGADKHLDSSGQIAASNPALGLRAIRLCLKEPELFRPQLRAILRASALGPVKLMLPMLTNVWEAMQAHALIEDEMRSLRAAGIAFDEDLAIGGMIEVPAAALAADSLAEQFDFLSIGTNDLIQYTLAIDRIDDEVNYLYDPLHPAVLILIQRVLDAGGRHGIPVSMCGEMAGEIRYIPLLLGMGLRSFSMQPNSLLDAKRIVRELDSEQLRQRIPPFIDRIAHEDPNSALVELLA